MRSTPVLLVGTLDTKGRELGSVRDVLRGHRIETMVIDAGSVGPPSLVPDVDREEVFRVNFGPRATVPERFAARRFHEHNPSVTLMRTTADECATLGGRMAEVLGRSRGPVHVMVPRGGVSALDSPGQPFHDPDADEALFSAPAAGLSGCPRVRLEHRDEHINDPRLADAAARAMLELLSPRREP